MASWGIAPHEVAERFTEEQLVELVPSLVTRTTKQSVTYQLAQLASSLSASQSVTAGASDRKYASGRTGRTYGSAQHPLTGAELEAAMRDATSRVGRGRGPIQ